MAIVIGIIMIGGATLIYNQARTSAGNARAQEKVFSLQQLVEEFAAQNQGSYITNLNDINVLFQRKRPDDWNKSPWGGKLGTQYSGDYGWQFSIGSRDNNTGGNFMDFENQPSTSVLPIPNASGTPVSLDTTLPIQGGLAYQVDPSNALYTWPDITTNRNVTFKGYSVFIIDQISRFPNYLTGGKAN